ncbi:MAG: hypothetical protein K9M75_11075 [Phycisphaerae bacterium]|nr:hypothetical protein [Phycisphaerae bacterium]
MNSGLKTFCWFIVFAVLIGIALGSKVLFDKTKMNSDSAKAKIIPTKNPVEKQVDKKIYITEGTVRDSAGAAISGARLKLASIRNAAGVEFRADLNGAFKIKYTSDDAEQLGFPHYFFVWSPDRKLGACMEVGGNDSSLNVILLPTVSLSGRVYNQRTGLMAGVSVDVFLNAKKHAIRLGREAVQTDALGRYTITGIPRGHVYTVNANCNNYVTGQVDANLTLTKAVDIEMKHAIILQRKRDFVSGIVVDSDNKPVSIAAILTRGLDGGMKTVQVNSEGKYSFDGIPVKQSFFVVAHAVVDSKIMTGWAAAEAGRDDIKIVVKADNPIPKDFSKVSVPKKTQSGIFKVTGIVRDPSGKPVVEAEISMHPYNFTADLEEVYLSDSNGKFQLTFEKAGSTRPFPFSDTYLIVRQPLHDLAVSRLFDKKENQLDIKLERGFTLTGRVVDANGAAISEAEVLVRFSIGKVGTIVPLSRDELGMGVYAVKTSKKGEFEIKAIPYGHKYSISAEDDAFRSGTVVIDRRNGSKNNNDQITILIQ